MMKLQCLAVELFFMDLGVSAILDSVLHVDVNWTNNYVEYFQKLFINREG